MKKTPFAPYSSPEELAQGRRKTALSLLLALGAVALAVLALRTVGDENLVTAYVGAGVIWFVVALAEAVRWSNTGEFERAD